ncbi:MAG: flagellar basal-body rod protein FlgF [Rhizobiaceae bacterium]|jgi:flagellar basal-body rod protein FlgF|nr:flagellar basal-body rod protein FlgF [Rhizobiaceae bacterium]
MAMNNAFGIGLSGLMALERRVELLAHNVANMNTVGFRADILRFQTDVERAGGAALAFAARGTAHVSTAEGARIQTGNALDVAIKGGGWMALGGESGPLYTRDGRMEITPEGALVNLTGRPVLDAGGSEISLNPQGGAIAIAADGTITQAGRRVAQLGLFSIEQPELLNRIGDVGFTFPGFAEPVADFRNTGFIQGFVEQANVNPIEQMASLITISRQFEAAANGLRSSEELYQSAIRTLGGSNN